MSGLSQIADEVVAYLEPIAEGLEFPASLTKLLDQIGAVKGNDAALIAALTTIVDFGQQCETFASQSHPSFEAAASLLELSRQAFSALSALTDAGGAVAGMSSLGEDLAELLASIWLVSRHPRLYSLAVLLSLIEADWDQTPSADSANAAGTDIVRYGFTIDRLHPSRIVDLIRDPVGTLRAEYASPLVSDTDAAALADKLFPRLQLLFSLLGLVSRYGISAADAADLKDWAAPMSHALVVYVQSVAMGDAADAGVVVTISPASQGDLGLVFALFGDLNVTQSVGPWTVAAQVAAGVDVIAWGRNGPALLASGAATELAASVTVTLPPPAQGPAVVFGSPTGTRLEVGGATASASTHLAQIGSSLAFNADVTNAKLVIAGGGDSFVSSLLPDDGLEANFNLGIGWSSDKGLTLRGSAGLQTDVPVSLSVGGVTLSQLHLALQAGDADVTGEISGIFSASIGPVQLAIDRVGIAANLSFPESGGNLGVADLSFGFKPPSGVGLAIDAIGVSGGGYLSFDPAKGQYAGVMQLHIDSGITLTAIGLIATRLPNGAKGYSFVVLITAEDFEPIPLGLGFTLTGIGGLLAINRTCDEEFLREGIKSNTLNSLLYPVDPIRNAVQILGTLNSAFPPRDGSYLFGPVVQICWGTPPVLTMDLGLILELGNRERLIILGRVSAIMPSEKHDLIRLQMNVLGIIDFDQHSISLDAILYDSRLVGKFPITGSMAMRLNWGSAPVFALSIGGFHPAFKPPAKFPTLERLAISFSNTDDFRLRAESYIAITSNTYQFGAKLELYASAGGFSIEGRVGYDVLIQYDPFGFAADFYASVQLKYHSDNLFAVKISGELAGPQPLHIKGKATFEIFWCDFSVSFDHTFLKGDPPPLLAPVEVLPLLKVALDDPRNWSGQLAEGERRMVTLRDRQAPGQIALHPLGKLAVQQTIVPLELGIAKFGNSKPADAHLFKINSLSVNGKATQFTLVKDFFAPSQFLELTDDERLAAPSFETMTAGISVGTEGFLFTTNDLDIVEDGAITYETIILDKGSNAPQAAPPVAITAEFLDRHISLGAAAHSDVRRTGNAKYRSVAGKNSLIRKGWTIVSTADGSAQAAPGLEAGKVVSYAETFQALHQLKQVNSAMAKNLMLLRVAAP